MKPTFYSYLEFMSSLEWKYSNITIDESHTMLVTLNDVKSGETGVVVIVKPLPKEIITISGSNQFEERNTDRESYLLIELCNKEGIEIQPTTKMIIRKVTLINDDEDGINENVIQVDRPLYEQLSMKNKLDGNLISYHKFYKFDIGIELKGEGISYGKDRNGTAVKNMNRLEIVAIKPDIDIDSKNTKITLKNAYIFKE